MVLYNFKKITVVPSAQEFIDIILSRTNRKTPTIIHKGYAINRIRAFYIRKVKFTQQNYHDKLTQIIDDFPLLDEIHPFYADLINVLYDKDHYKLALGQLNTCRHLIDKIAKDYVQMIKHGDSLYRCKCLKRAGLGRMCTLMRKQKASLEYLEEVRKHLSRLPSIEPNTRTLLLCGYPNVGKSSFMNKITRANVDVQPYAFTTKSLFVGHSDYNYLRWQIIDTPGILDHPLSERNTIEMQSITALAHLRAAIVFIVDISEQCGYSITEQVELFNSISPLFAGKPIVIVLNKIDVVKPGSLTMEQKSMLSTLEKNNSNVKLIPMSNLSEEGVISVKQQACDMLLAQRVEIKKMGKAFENNINKLHVAMPTKRDLKERPPTIPANFVPPTPELSKKERQQAEKPVAVIRYASSSEMNLVDPDYDPSKRSIDFRKDYLLANEEWKFDSIPEILDGKNLADFVDPDIDAMLQALEKEEEARLEAIANEMDEDDHEWELTDEQQAMAEVIREEKHSIIHQSRLKRTSKPKLARKDKAQAEVKVDAFKRHLTDMGINPDKAVKSVRQRSKSRGRSLARIKEDEDAMEVGSVTGGKRKRSKSRELSVSPGDGFKNIRQKVKAVALERQQQKKGNKDARQGEADRRIYATKPKHLFSGKRGIGKTDRR